jgi:hypothetical protein
LEQFQREKRKVIKALKYVKGDLASLEGTKYVTRGFECYQTIELNRLVRKQRRAVVESIMNVQRQQREQLRTHQHEHVHEQQQLHLEEAIAQAARQESAWARELAHQLGLKDEETVRFGWQDFFAEVATYVSNSDSETSLSSLVSAQEDDDEDDGPTPSNTFDHMHFEHVTCMVDNCSATPMA